MADPFAHSRIARLMRFRRFPKARHLAQRQYDRLMEEVDECDAALTELVARRRTAAQALTELVDNHWPRLLEMQGYQPPVAEELPYPDISPDAEPIIASRLRSVALTLLRHHGECSLTTVHRLLIMYGFVIGCPTPVKALSDALRHETEEGRAIRVRRGVYAPDPRFRPTPGCFGDVALLPPTPWKSTLEDDLPSPVAWT